MGLYNHPIGGGDEAPFGVVLLVAVRLVVVGAGGGLEGGVLHQVLAGEGQGEEAARVGRHQQGGGEHHRGLGVATAHSNTHPQTIFCLFLY